MLAQHAVHTVADGAERAARLDVDVAGSLGDPVVNDQAREADHRRRGCVVLGNGLRAHLLDELDGSLVEGVHVHPAEQRLHRPLGREARVERLLDRTGRGHLEVGRASGAEAEGSLGLHVRGITGGDDQVALVLDDREDEVLARHRLGDQPRGVRVGRRQVGHAKAEVLRHQGGELLVREAKGPRHHAPGVLHRRAGWDLGAAGPAVSGALRDPDQPVHGHPPRLPTDLRRIAHRSLSAAARLPCFSRYIALSASATMSSRRTLGSSSW